MKKIKVKAKIPKVEVKVQRNHIKVINLIDLVQSEDFPKLYQVPLSLKVYD